MTRCEHNWVPYCFPPQNRTVQYSTDPSVMLSLRALSEGVPGGRSFTFPGEARLWRYSRGGA